MNTFETILDRNSSLLKSIQERGFEKATEIQEKTIPEILKGKDIIAGASTGSGKTLAFASGLLNNVKKEGYLQGLVLTPTRELAEQITNELKKFSKFDNLHITSIYGGVSINNQIRELSTTNIVVGTPGRILDLLSRKKLNLTNINTLVLDEADRMLDMGFINDVKKIIFECPKKRQTLLFSATIEGELYNIVEKYMNNPIEIYAEEFVDPLKLTQVYYDIQDSLKFSLLAHLLEQEKSKLVLIFCNTRKNVEFVSENLKSLGMYTLALHGGYSQDKRNRMIEEFNSNNKKILVATDVAARGLHIEGISHVYNFDIPSTKKDYIHRIGRTARAGEQGKIINLLASRDYENFRQLQFDEFKIQSEKTPFIKKVSIRWLPQKRNERGFRRGHSKGRFNNSRTERNNSYKTNRNTHNSNRTRRNNRGNHRKSSRNY